MDYKLALLEYGLDEKEVDCYIYLLKQIKASANEISKNIGILRQTVYDVLNRLEYKGLVSQMVENSTTYFMAEDPLIFIEKLKEKKEIMETVLPVLENMKNLNQSLTNVKLYKGLKGIKSLFISFLETNGSIYTIQPEIKGEEILKEFYIKNFSVKRIDKKIPIFILREKIISNLQEELKTNKEKLREVRLSKEVSGIDTHYILYDNKLVMIAYRDELVGIEIEDPMFSNSFKILFDNIWKRSKIF